jgi:cytochrome c peroxidase
MLLFPRPSSGQVVGPLPPIKKPPNLVPLTPVEQLGKDIVFDITLSDPPGYACFTCHTPETGHASPGPPDGSEVNAILGIPSGVVPGRFANRKLMTYAATAFSPIGPFYYATNGIYVGGTFWDGRTPDEAHQALQPPIDANEMANLSSNGVQDPVAGGYSALVVQKVQSRPYTHLFKKVYGPDVFTKYTTQQLYSIITDAIAAYEASAEINPFNSKYDASPYGMPAQNLYTFSASEERGRILYGVGPNPNNDPTFGMAQCFQCHSSAGLTFLQPEVEGKEMFTMYCYANIGVPKNPANPYYQNTDAASNPFGYNPLGTAYIDYGLGSNPNPAPDGTMFYNNTPGDIAQFRGLFKAPSVRNSDKRPSPTFVKAFMHNGVFKSLEEVVHFYNKRNIAVDANGNEVAFDLRNGPPSGCTAIFPPPEVLDNVQNVAGLTPAQAAAQGVSGVVATNGQVGNLQLTPSQETDLVNFLKILTDGYGPITPVSFS